MYTCQTVYVGRSPYRLQAGSNIVDDHIRELMFPHMGLFGTPMQALDLAQHIRPISMCLYTSQEISRNVLR